MSHEAFQEKLLDLVYGELSPREARKVEDHAASCEACGAELARMRATRRTMAALPQEEAPERGAGILLAAAREAAGRRQRRRLPSWLLGTAVAAASLVAVGAVSFRLIAMRPGPLRGGDDEALLGRSPYASAPSAAQGAPPSPAEGPAAPSSARQADAPPAPAAPGQAEAPSTPSAPDRAEAPSAPSAPGRAEAPSSLSPREAGGEGQGEGGRAPRSSSEAPRASPAPQPPPARDAARAEAEPFRASAKAAGAPSAAESYEAPADADAAASAAAPSREEPPAPAPAPAAPRERRSASAPSAGAQAAPASRPAAPSAPAPSARAPEAAPAEKSAAPDRRSALRERGAPREEVRTFPGCEGESVRRVERDPEGRVVRYVREGRIGGRRLRVEHVFGPDGALVAATARDLDAPAAAVDAGALGLDLPRRAEEADLDAPPRCGR